MQNNKTYKINEVYYLATRGLSFFIESDLSFDAIFSNEKIKLLSNGKCMPAYTKGIETFCGKNALYRHSLLLASFNDSEKELMNFLKIEKKNGFQNLKDVHFETEMN